ncbi:hypothetical protein AK830_g5211 [Neonectria ditissima]|uniref:Uncharacterized protein n=1 Tax=Neonectria ditissima TaxID=78410 RepID=A0A0P7BLP5_9HYPO|nr:hypothetical protein AK830_g5211 [Neonectria ditissima]
MPYTSRRLVEYRLHFDSDSNLENYVYETSSPPASESGFHDAFVDDAKPASPKQQVDPEERDDPPSDSASPRLEMYNFSTPQLAHVRQRSGSCLISRDGSWDDATTDIVTFCSRNFRQVSWEDLDEPTQVAFTRMTPYARQLMDIPYGNVHLFAGRIWRIIDEAIFQKTNTDSVEWESPYFKHQNDMLKELRRSKHGAPHSHMTQMWRQWDYLSFCLFQGTVDSPPDGRISLDYFYRIIKDGIGPLFPKRLSEVCSMILNRVALFFIEWEATMAYCQDYHYFLFGHPGTLKTSGFTFRSNLTDSSAMKGMDGNSFRTEKNFEGCRVDLIAAPTLMSVKYTKSPEDFSRIPLIEIPMVVCAGWIDDLDGEGGDYGDFMTDAESDLREADGTAGLVDMDKDDGQGEDDVEPTKTDPGQTEADSAAGLVDMEKDDEEGEDDVGSGKTEADSAAGLVDMEKDDEEGEDDVGSGKTDLGQIEKGGAAGLAGTGKRDGESEDDVASHRTEQDPIESDQMQLGQAKPDAAEQLPRKRRTRRQG